jgi:hypothetical protein
MRRSKHVEQGTGGHRWLSSPEDGCICAESDERFDLDGADCSATAGAKDNCAVNTDSSGTCTLVFEDIWLEDGRCVWHDVGDARCGESETRVATSSRITVPLILAT